MNEEILILYLTYLSSVRGQAATTIASTLSGLTFMLQCKKLNPLTISKTFMVKNFMSGLRKSSTRATDSRQPITLKMLNSLIASLKESAPSEFEYWLFSAMFSLAFFALLRVGEITFCDSHSPHLLDVNSVKVIIENDNLKAFKLTMSSFKHSTGIPFTIEIPSQNFPLDPVVIMYNYLLRRGTNEGPLFCAKNLYPIHRSVFVKVLNLSLQNIVATRGKFTTHSFRIGGATHAAESGMSDSKIRALGRWKSNAFQKYIRISSSVN